MTTKVTCLWTQHLRMGREPNGVGGWVQRKTKIAVALLLNCVQLETGDACIIFTVERMHARIAI